MARPEERCVRCGRTPDEVRLEKCAICHKLFCWTCSTRRHGKLFCSVACADLFFFGEEDEG